MHTGAVICEYNPFHNGHAFQLRYMRQQLGCDAVVCMMSGNFVQRGEPAVLDKWTRARVALQHGADLVLELPTPYALCSGEGFARHGVALLHRTGVVDILCFGSECGDTTALMNTAAFLLQPEILAEIRAEMKDGAGFAAVRQRVVERHHPTLGKLLAQPNDILGIEYCKALLTEGSHIQPAALLRRGAGHHSGQAMGEFASGSYLRQHYWQEQAFHLMPPQEVHLLRQASPLPSVASLEQALLYQLRTMQPEQLREIYDVSEGLEYRILSSAAQSLHFQQLLAELRTRRYPDARLRRVLMCALLGIQKQWNQEPAYYLRVLGCNRRGMELLAQMRHTAAYPVLTKPAHYRRLTERERELFELECRCTSIYSLAAHKLLDERIMNPVILLPQ